MIVLALALLGYGFYKKTDDPNWRLFGSAEVSKPSPAPILTPKSTPAPVPSLTQVPALSTTHPPVKYWRGKPIEPWGDVSLGLAPGCRIAAIKPARRLLYLTIGPDGTCARIIIFDVQKGRVVGSIRTGP